MTTVNGKRTPDHPYRVGCMCDVCMDIRTRIRLEVDLRKEDAERRARAVWKRP